MKQRVPDVLPKLTRAEAYALLDACYSRGVELPVPEPGARWTHRLWKPAQSLAKKGLVTISEPHPERFPLVKARPESVVTVVATEDGRRRCLGGRANGADT